MTNLTQHVVSLELAKELKEAGYPQEKSTFFQWLDYRSDNKHSCVFWQDREKCLIGGVWHEDGIAAPLASEIGELLPDYTRELGNIEISYCATDHITMEPNSKIGRYNGKWWNVSYWLWTNKLTPKHKYLFLERESKHLQQSATLPNALAKMYLYLKREGLI